MPGDGRYWMSPQRGLPPPSGRLGGAIEFCRSGAIEVPWFESGGLGALPPPAYLQSEGQARATIESARRAQRYVQEARARAGLAHGPGASPPPPLPYAEAPWASQPPAPGYLPSDLLVASPGPLAHAPNAAPYVGPDGPGVPSRLPYESEAVLDLPPEPTPYGPAEARGVSPGMEVTRPPPMSFERKAREPDIGPGRPESWERRTSGPPSPYPYGRGLPRGGGFPLWPFGLQSPYGGQPAPLSAPRPFEAAWRRGLSPGGKLPEGYYLEEARRRWIAQMGQEHL